MAVAVPAVISAVREITRENISAVEPGNRKNVARGRAAGEREPGPRAQRLNEII